MKSTTLIDLLQLRSQQFGSEPKYARLNSALEVEERLSFADLEQGARASAHEIREHAAPGDRVLLALTGSIDFLKAFFGCLYARTIPVPVCPPRPNRSFDAFSAIAADAGASHVITAAPLPTIKRLDCEKPQGLESRPAEGIAFLQYTSGATAAPKGVIITHRNVLSNCAYIQAGFHHDPNTVALTWLPHYHDMGLIAGLLQPLYIGHACYTMPAMSFLQQPVRWLRAISNFRVDHSGAQTFAYRLCCDKIDEDEISGLDLGCWRTAYVGAEPVHADVLERFTAKFGRSGFRRSAFYPAYGLAEATLKVTGGQPGEGPTYSTTSARITGCGRPSNGTEVRIANPETETPVIDGESGEIWVRGPGVARGYWGCKPQWDDGSYLRTGDLGMMIDGELFITGRLKDLIIIRSRNIHPENVEKAVIECTDPNGRAAAAFSIIEGGEEQIVVVVEISTALRCSTESAAKQIRKKIAEELEVEIYQVMFVRAGTIPRTTSGKVRRSECAKMYSAGLLRPVDTTTHVRTAMTRA